jgi:hypothetical protein
LGTRLLPEKVFFADNWQNYGSDDVNQWTKSFWFEVYFEHERRYNMNFQEAK